MIGIREKPVVVEVDVSGHGWTPQACGRTSSYREAPRRHGTPRRPDGGQLQSRLSMAGEYS